MKLFLCIKHFKCIVVYTKHKIEEARKGLPEGGAAGDQRGEVGWGAAACAILQAPGRQGRPRRGVSPGLRGCGCARGARRKRLKGMHRAATAARACRRCVQPATGQLDAGTARSPLERLTKLSEAVLARRCVVGSTSITTRRGNDARRVLLAALSPGGGGRLSPPAAQPGPARPSHCAGCSGCALRAARRRCPHRGAGWRP